MMIDKDSGATKLTATGTLLPEETVDLSRTKRCSLNWLGLLFVQ